ncbi:MAG: hypothetical protein SX243_21825 [Acidobacteriota bacterium]|nr:hypothetical protein [Acidobacteriota bacterium]
MANKDTRSRLWRLFKLVAVVGWLPPLIWLIDWAQRFEFVASWIGFAWPHLVEASKSWGWLLSAVWLTLVVIWPDLRKSQWLQSLKAKASGLNADSSRVDFEVVCDDSPGSEAVLRVENRGDAAHFSAMARLAFGGWPVPNIPGATDSKRPDRWRHGLWENSRSLEVKIPKFGAHNLVLARYSVDKDDEGALRGHLHWYYLENGSPQFHPMSWAKEKVEPPKMILAVQITCEPPPAKPYDAIILIEPKSEGGLRVLVGKQSAQDLTPPADPPSSKG